jgi:prepilin-type N-terminal cleavage/methylation domain-containing protein
MCLSKYGVKTPAQHAPSDTRHGFTLVEIMIVALIIGLLTTLAVPAFVSARRDSLNVAFVNDLRKAADAFDLYATEHGTYPPDATPGNVPAGIAPYLPKMNWAGVTPIGGRWDWDYLQWHFGCRAGVSVYRPDRSDAQMRVIDALIDDGDLTTGIFRKRNAGFIYIVER